MQAALFPQFQSFRVFCDEGSSVMRRKSLHMEALEKAIYRHSRGCNRESSVFKKKRTLDSRLSTAGITAQDTRNIYKEALDALH